MHARAGRAGRAWPAPSQRRPPLCLPPPPGRRRAGQLTCWISWRQMCWRCRAACCKRRARSRCVCAGRGGRAESGAVEQPAPARAPREQRAPAPARGFPPRPARLPATAPSRAAAAGPLPLCSWCWWGTTGAATCAGPRPTCRRSCSPSEEGARGGPGGRLRSQRRQRRPLQAGLELAAAAAATAAAAPHMAGRMPWLCRLLPAGSLSCAARTPPASAATWTGINSADPGAQGLVLCAACCAELSSWCCAALGAVLSSMWCR